MWAFLRQSYPKRSLFFSSLLWLTSCLIYFCAFCFESLSCYVFFSPQLLSSVISGSLRPGYDRRDFFNLLWFVFLSSFGLSCIVLHVSFLLRSARQDTLRLILLSQFRSSFLYCSLVFCYCHKFNADNCTVLFSGTQGTRPYGSQCCYGIRLIISLSSDRQLYLFLNTCSSYIACFSSFWYSSSSFTICMTCL